MIRKSSAAIAAFLIIIFSFFVLITKGQPVLPDLAGVSQKGVNILTWTCQYDGIKSIAVTRSSDSLHNFTTIGYVKNVKKGVQVFADGHPLPGYNWYELSIIFNSDLTWNSNKIKMFIDSAVIINQKVVLPPNDSLQKFIVSSTDKQASKPIEKSPVKTNAPGGHAKPKSNIVVTIDQDSKNTTVVTSIKPGQETVALNDSIVKPIPKITISLNADVDIDPLSYIKSQYIFTDPVSGHINMVLPDVKKYHYSVKFLSDKNKMVIDVPRITESPIIIDKRNFQRKGLYKFVLKRDNKEFESGNITIY